MSTDKILQISSHSLEDTTNLAAIIGSRLRGGEVIALSSDLGGGKTAFVRGLANGLGSSDHVSSPTFTISRQYSVPAKNLTLYHFDFYRLAEPGLMALELTEITDDPRAIVAIEWATIVAGLLPPSTIKIQIESTGNDDREFMLEYSDDCSYLFDELPL